MNLYLPIEILQREFQSKLLIGMECASKGMNVYMGRLVPYLTRNFFVPGVVLQKSITPSPERLEELNYYKNKKFIITSLDEEVGLVNIGDNYIKRRYANETLNLTDKVFTWGKFDYLNLVKNFKNHKKKFFLSGNPRLDLWKKKFNFFYDKKNLKYENYIFFSLNFSFLFSKSKFNKFLKFLKKSNYVKRGFSIEHAIKLREDSFRMYKKFLKLIIALSSQTKKIIIVRPHPADPLENYDVLKKYKNVKIINEGNISEWIYHSEIVVHSGCTGGLEASIRGKPTISYLPFESAHGEPFTDKFSMKVKKKNECIKLIKELIKKKKIRKPNMKLFNFRAFNFLSNKPSYEIISDEILKLIKSKKLYYKNNDLFLKLKFQLRDFRSNLLKNKYGNIKFSIFDQNETIKIFGMFKELNPNYRNLNIDFIKKDILEIKKIIK